MMKKELKAIPIPKADVGQIHEIAVGNKNIRGIIISQKKKVESEETLILNVYQVSGKNKKDISLLFRVFCQKNDYITYEVDCNKWRTGALLYLVCRDSGWSEYWWNYKQLEFLTDRDAKRVERTLRKWNHNNREYGDRAAFTLFDQYQGNVKNARLMKKHKKETDVIDADMEKFGELPDDYQTFVEEKVFKDDNYIFYDTKKKRAFCTGCKKTYILENKHLRHETIGVFNNRDEVKHNRTVCCPYCNKFIMAKSEGMSRQSLVSVRWSLLVQPHNEEVLTRYFCHTKDFRIDFHNPKITIHEGYRTIHRADKATDYMWADYKTTGNMRWCYYRDRGTSWYPPAETVAPRGRVVMYNANLQESVTGTCMKYSAPDIFIENVANDERYFKSPWLVDNYFNSYRKYPFIEQLLKVGFYRMTRDFLEDFHSAHVKLNDGQNSILGTLGINKNQYNMLRKIGDPRMKDLEILRYKPDLKWNEFEDLRWIQDNGRLNFKNYIDFMRYSTLHKLHRYINEQKIIHAIDYFDYIGWLEEMRYDMRNEFNLFPKNFEKAHDEKSKLYMKFKDKQAREAAKRFNNFLKELKKGTAEVEAMNLNINGLFIRLPNELEELKREGEALHHCVGTYMEEVAKGKTMIFFIRKKVAPEKPYYTLEWNGRVVQCQGFCRCDMTPEVKEFVYIFQEKMAEYENEPKKQRKAG